MDADALTVEIRIDRGTCIGSGQCVHWAPAVFDQDDEGIAVVVDPRGEAEERIVHAVTACPMQAITLHVGGSRVGPEELRDWSRGAHGPEPVVALLEQLAEEHHGLQAAFDAFPSDDGTRADTLASMTTAHLRNEEQVYGTLTELVEPRLVDAFEDDHARIDNALEELVAGGHRAERGEAMQDLARVLGDHIRLEETVLFPLALSALARRRSTLAREG